MGKSVLFLIHGVGDHDAKWADNETEGGPALALRRAWRKYSHYERTKQELEEFVEFVPILYNDVFDSILDGWSDLAGEAAALGGAVPDEMCQVAMDACEEAGNDKNKLIRYGGDVVLYKGFRLFAQRVQMKVIRRMAEVIAERTSAGGDQRDAFFVMAHSLGTTVAHDSLHHLATEDWLKWEPETEARSDWERESRLYRGLLGSGKTFQPPAFRFNAVFMLSNTSNLLHTAAEEPYSSAVVPNGYCRNYLNFDHMLDPISKVGRFVMPAAWMTTGRVVDISDLNHLHAVNFHAFDHYLAHPRVHIKVFMQLVEGFRPTGEDLAKRAGYPRFGSDFGGRDPAVLVGELGKLVPKAIPEEPQAQLKLWLEVYRELLKLTGNDP